MKINEKESLSWLCRALLSVRRAEALPLLVFASAPALIIRLATLPINAESAAFQYGTIEYELLAWWKAVFVFGCAIWMVIHVGLRLTTGWQPRQRMLVTILVAAAATTLLSTVLSLFPLTSWVGLAGQREGAIVIISYLIAIWYSAEFVGTTSSRLLILRCIGMVICINAALGIGQGFGVDFWQTDLGRSLAGMGEMSFRYNFAISKMSYGASFQPNHYGMFVAMAGAMAVVMIFAERRKGWKVFWAVASLLCLVAVVFSQSRAALGVFVIVGGGFSLSLLWRNGIRLDPAATVLRWPEFTKRHFWIVALVIAVMLAVGSLPQVRRSIVSQWKRSAAEFGIEQKNYPVRNLELVNDRIIIGLEDSTVSLGKNARMHWNAEITVGGISRACGLRLQEEADGWTRILPEPLPECTITFHTDGRIRFRSEGADARFFTAGRKIFAVDYDDRLHSVMKTPRSLPIGGMERLMSGRGYIWSRSLALLPDHPWFGSGPGTFAHVFPNEGILDMQRHFYRASEDKAHGVWLALLVQQGIVGFVIFMALLSYIVYKGFVADSLLAKAALAGVLAYALGAFTNDSTVGVTPIFCLLCGLCVNASNSHPNDASSPPATPE